MEMADTEQSADCASGPEELVKQAGAGGVEGAGGAGGGGGHGKGLFAMERIMGYGGN